MAWLRCGGLSRHWCGRLLFEAARLQRLVSGLGIDVYLTPSGTVAPFLSVPQVSMALNPWALVMSTQRTAAERVKGRLQRHAYRQTVRRAALVAYGSRYMQRLYRENAGREEGTGVIAYPAAADDVHAAAALPERPARDAGHVLCVAVMAPHKGVETLVRSVAELRRDAAAPVTLSLVGPWPDARYERDMRSLARQLGVAECVRFAGHVPREELLSLYARARVFALTSQCESFAIPCVEAQAFGTPVLASDCCASPEVCGAGGVYVPPGDVSRTAREMLRLLSDGDCWKRSSDAAIANAQRFIYDLTSRPLMGIFRTF